MASAKPSTILHRDNLVALARLVGAVALAGLAVAALRGEGPLLDAYLFLAGAAALFLVEFGRRPALERPHAPLPAEPPLRREQWTALGLAVAPAVVALLLFAGNRLSRLGVALLAIAIGVIVAATWQRAGERAATAAATQPDLLPPRARHLALAGIVALAAVFRLYMLDTLPGDMFNDLAYNYQETRTILDGEWMIYATGFPGREPLLFYLTALLSHLTGLNFFTLKLITALLGIATVPVVYLLGREAYNDAVGLVAALLLAVAKWHVLISRVGFRGIQTALVVALVLLFLLRGLRRGRRGDFLWAGAFAGLALYTYTAALAIWPAVLLGLGLYALAGHARDLARVRRSLLLGALVALLVALPMLRYMFLEEEGRERFWFRPLTRVSDTEISIPAPVGEILARNLARTAGMFHLQGDSIFRTNVPYDPHLDPAAGLFFLLGLPLVLLRFRRGGNSLVLVFFVMLLLPTTLALAFPLEVPGAVRSSGALATVMLFPAVAVVAAWQRLGEVLAVLKAKWAWGALLGGLALWAGLFNAHLCFVEYPKTLPEENYPLYREIAGAIDRFGGDGAVLLKTIPHWDDKDAIRLQTQGYKEWGLHGEIVGTIDPAIFQALHVPRVAVILQPERDPDSLAELARLYPHGLTILYRDPRGKVQFGVFLFRMEAYP